MKSSAKKKLNNYLHLLQQDEDNLPLLIDIFHCYYEEGKLQLAKQYLDRASAINPELCFALQGRLHLDLQQIEEAIPFFTQAIEVIAHPANHYNLAYCYYLQEDFNKARAILHALLEKGHFPEAYLLLARIEQEQDRIKEAILQISTLLSHEKDHPEATGLLAMLYFESYDYDLAEKTAFRALRLNPQNFDARLVKVLCQLPKQQNNLEEVQALLSLQPKDSRLWFALGSTYLSKTEFQYAEQAFKQALLLNPDFYDVWIAQGWTQLMVDNLEEAFYSYTQASNIQNNLSDAWGGLAIVYALQENFVKAHDMIEKANAINEDCFLSQIAQTIYFEHINPHQAQIHFRKAFGKNIKTMNQKLEQALLALDCQETLH
jgi:tetratricopeptide (TPR) repeat protein